MSPLAFRYVPERQYNYLVAFVELNDVEALNIPLKQAWQKLFPTQLYPGRLMEYNIALEHFDSVVILYTFLGW
jgi:hypothetical protein